MVQNRTRIHIVSEDDNTFRFTVSVSELRNMATRRNAFESNLHPTSIISISVILLSLIMHNQAAAFIHHYSCLDYSNSHSYDISASSLMVTPSIGDDDGFQDDTDFYRDLRQAKRQKLGGSIPQEQARKSAVQAEGEFLEAMRETKDEFQKAKLELGSDGAIDLFLERIKEEDERNDEEF